MFVDLKKNIVKLYRGNAERELEYQHYCAYKWSLTRDPYEPLTLPRQTFSYIYPTIPPLLHETEYR